MIADHLFGERPHRRVRGFGERLLSGIDVDLPRRIGDMRDLRVAGFRGVVRQSRAADGQRRRGAGPDKGRSEEHTSEPQSLMRLSYAAFGLKKQKVQTTR